MKSIGLCLIAKNEAHVITRCIDSARPLVDFVLVVDTGSTDDTPRIVREYLAEVVRKDVLENGMIGIGFKTLIEITERSYSFDAPGQQN